MTPADWERIQNLFHEAAGLPPEERTLYLRQQCGENAALLHEVETLLAESDTAEGLFAGAVEEAAADVLAAEHGERIGPYAVDRRLGEGGMGAVYLAVRDDDQYRKQVAIKLVRSGLQGGESIARFRAERQILANLDHPGIARLLDGGATPEGAPYVVMEYVDGVPIDEYCAHAQLSIHGRLLLFLQVCEAVAYAHRNLVVHRDIKPANILVTHDGLPKLLDFGIAKLLIDDPLVQNVRTMAMDRLMTPDYASPEQVRGGAITTATDVYSLGMLLYELLTGTRPFRMHGNTFAQCERLICETEPVKPSAEGAGHKELSGDLDFIILMALRKEPSRRYGSVELLAQDIRRHLDGLPVIARPDSWRYRAGKFALRHRLGMSAGAAIVLILVIAVILTMSAQQRAVAANTQAQQHFQDMLAMADSSLFEVHDAIVNLPGSTQARALVVRRALSYLDRLAKDHNQDPALRRELASAYERLSLIQYHDGAGYLGDSAGALASAEQALRIRRQLAAEAPHDPAALRAVAADLSHIGDVQRMTRNLKASEGSYAEGLAILDNLHQAAPADRAIERDLADAHKTLGDAMRESGEPNAPNHLQQALQMWEALMRANPADRDARRGVEQTCLSLGAMERDQRDNLGRAIEFGQRALTLARALSSEFPEDRGYRTDVASALGELGHSYLKGPAPRQSLPFYEESLSIVESLSHSDPGDARMRRSVAIHNTNIAILLDRLLEDGAAEARYRRSLDIHVALLEGDPKNRQYMDDVAFVRSDLGLLLVRTGRIAEGADQLKKSVAMREALLAADPSDVDAVYRLGRSYEALGRERDVSKDPPGACRLFQHAREILLTIRDKHSETADLERLATRLAACRQ